MGKNCDRSWGLLGGLLVGLAQRLEPFPHLPLINLARQRVAAADRQSPNAERRGDRMHRRHPDRERNAKRSATHAAHEAAEDGARELWEALVDANLRLAVS